MNAQQTAKLAALCVELSYLLKTAAGTDVDKIVDEVIETLGDNDIDVPGAYDDWYNTEPPTEKPEIEEVKADQFEDDYKLGAR